MICSGVSLASVLNNKCAFFQWPLSLLNSHHTTRTKRPPRKQACLRPRDRFWDIPVPKIDSAFDNLLVPQPSWSPSTTQQLRKLVAAPYLAPNDWTPRSEAYFVFPLAQGTPGKQCGLAATGVYQPSLRSPWLAAWAINTLLR
uniref:hypothetical protein n=1 Tax=Thiolapillus sp. TaxID=2017437 RepID=UPI003AF9A32B